MQAKDYYNALGVSENAAPDEIKKAYRKIAKKNHPDQNPGDAAAEERFKEASEAYGVLGDEEKRKRYDALRKYGFGDAQGGGFPGGGFPGGGSGGFPGGVRFRTGPGGSQHIVFETGDPGDLDFKDLFGDRSPFGDIFDQLFGRSFGGGRVRREAPSPPPRDSFFRRDGLDVHCTVTLDGGQLEKGAKVKVRTPAGKKALVTVPAGTESGAVLRLKGLGLSRNGNRGDQFVHVASKN